MISNPFSYISENEDPELYKNGGRYAMLQILPQGRSAMKGGRSAMLQTFPLGEGLQCCRSSGGRSAMLQIFRGGGRYAMLQTFRGKGLQGGKSAIQQRHIKRIDKSGLNSGRAPKPYNFRWFVKCAHPSTRHPLYGNSMPSQSGQKWGI